ncbi:MAG: hypothetical protein ACTHWW_12045 [Arthrobacter sp.]|uniref:hypothetical protein n=1 Tax=unclassified Arthrobacter TaxID=235627 RepID=UPI002655A32B|nr:hypothetical protein [Micrococcaceae bacterium]MDN5813528.1 hypothetical protein [Micrococcaceae bacterium]MDN5824897.1 hypothetical protein [Micrococcaceae bacterium]MDN5880412.1 hypothetical protein [Micrococcaceae bacterium]MDN5887830.1 hypothetical protein [Micrococcaceae bacterium]
MAYVEVLLPTIVAALVFWFVMRALFRVDRNERLAESAADAHREGTAPTEEPDPGSADRPGE